MWGRIQEQTTNFEHFVHETWPQTCCRVVFKLYKKQMKSENHETCEDVMISYVEVMIKIKKVSRKLSRTMLANRSRPLHEIDLTSVLSATLGKVATFAECLSQWRSANQVPLPSAWPWHSAKPPSRWHSPSRPLFFAECRIGTRHRAPFAECNTWQRLCQVYISLCRVPQALGKEAASGSDAKLPKELREVPYYYEH